MPMIAKIVQTAKQTVNAIVDSQSALFWSDELGLPCGMSAPAVEETCKCGVNDQRNGRLGLLMQINSKVRSSIFKPMLWSDQEIQAACSSFFGKMHNRMLDFYQSKDCSSARN
jgi:hypothetical protein